MKTSAPPRILVVDDEEPILNVLRQILTHRGYDVQITKSGIEALYLLAQNDYQLMITDIKMPQMDGLELTRRALEFDPDLAIILTTGVGNRERAYQAYELGAVGYLLKPFDPNEIRIYVANALRLRELEIAHRAQLDQLETQVEQSEIKLKTVVDQLRVILWAVDSDGVFTLSEGKGLTDLGLQPGQVVGQSALRLYRHIPELCQTLQRAMEGETFSYLIWINDRLYETHNTPLKNNSDMPNGVIGVSIDVTETHRLQQQISRKARLASLGELAAGVAHEINNPNALVLLNSRELVKIYADIAPILAAHYQQKGQFKLGSLDYTDLRDELPHLLEHNVESAQRIKEIVGDLKAYASDEENSPVERVDLNQMVRSALPYVQQLLNDSTDHFSIEYADNPLLVKGESKKLEQIVINLLQNACHALADKSAAICLSLSRDKENQTQVLKVQDEGCGISDENLARLKEPFFTTRRNGGGTGLGLSVSNRLVEDCAGQLEFTSTLGIGTTAILTLPACNEDSSL